LGSSCKVPPARTPAGAAAQPSTTGTAPGWHHAHPQLPLPTRVQARIIRISPIARLVPHQVVSAVLVVIGALGKELAPRVDPGGGAVAVPHEVHACSTMKADSSTNKGQ
jgi:hypothetical protein